MKTYAFIDASNLFYGGEKSLGWKIDYEKLYKYLEEKYDVSVIYYFGSIETYKFPFDYLNHDTVPIEEFEKYLVGFIYKNRPSLSNNKLETLNHYLKRIRFYGKLENFGFRLILKPVKFYIDEFGNTERKANCDVEITVRMIRESESFDRVIFMSGDGDFLSVLKFLREMGKEVLVFARAKRTAHEIRKFAGDKFLDFTYLREILRYEE